MKTMKNYSVLVLVSLIFCNFTPYVNAQETDLYHSSMQKALIKLVEVKSPGELSDCRNQFERIGTKFGDKWLPLYYTAFCDIEMVYWDKVSEHNTLRVENARKSLEKLASFSDADLSEISTLWGYYYNALIVLNPASAQDVFGKVIAAYEKAIEVNPENPRPVILRVFFNQFLPSFIQLKIDPKAEVEKAKALFAKQDKSTRMPVWGENFVSYIKIEE